MKRLLLLSFVILMLYGCSGIDVSEELIEEKTEMYCIEVEVPVVSGLSDEMFQQTLNDELAQNVKKLTDAFKTRISETDGETDELTAKTYIYRTNSTISIISDIYEDNGGAHGISSRPCVTVDVLENKKLTLEDLFIDDKWRDMLNRRLAEIVQSEGDKYSDLWEKPVVMDGQSFYIDGTNLVIYYPPYELSYYARGFVEFTIPIESMSGYVKKEYIGR